MFGYQLFLEALDSLKAHKMRTVFTGFGVMWAMLILVLLQGAGTGLYNGMVTRFQRYSDRLLYIYAGYRLTDQMHLTEALTDDLASNLNVFEHIMPVFRTNSSVAYGQNLYKSPILGVRIGYEKMKYLELVAGRFFSERDVVQRLPVCILGLKMKTDLFDRQEAVGQFITIDGTVLAVIGVLEATAGIDDDKVIIPSSLFKALFPNHAEQVDSVIATLAPKQNPLQVEKKVRAYLARRLHFDAEDRQAVYIHSLSKRARSFQLLFIMMQAFIWLVSFCFLVSGVVGVGNMMLVVVKERTQELAIRKVVGAKSSHIIGLILFESVAINLISGILGLGAGITILRWVNNYLLPIIEKYGIARFEFQFPGYALVVLVCSGCLAGMIPVQRALSIRPVDALNNE